MIKTTAVVATKFCAMIKTTQILIVCGPDTNVSKIVDGRHFEKSINHYLSQGLIDAMKFCMVIEIFP